MVVATMPAMAATMPTVAVDDRLVPPTTSHRRGVRATNRATTGETTAVDDTAMPQYMHIRAKPMVSPDTAPRARSAPMASLGTTRASAVAAPIPATRAVSTVVVALSRRAQ